VRFARRLVYTSGTSTSMADPGTENTHALQDEYTAIEAESTDVRTTHPCAIAIQTLKIVITLV